MLLVALPPSAPSPHLAADPGGAAGPAIVPVLLRAVVVVETKLDTLGEQVVGHLVTVGDYMMGYM